MDVLIQRRPWMAESGRLNDADAGLSTASLHGAEFNPARQTIPNIQRRAVSQTFIIVHIDRFAARTIDAAFVRYIHQPYKLTFPCHLNMVYKLYVTGFAFPDDNNFVDGRAFVFGHFYFCTAGTL
jgi:hypothetical protein